jgi:hypothetical protein
MRFAKKGANSILCLLVLCLLEFKSANADLEDVLLVHIGKHVPCLAATINPRLEHDDSDLISMDFSAFHNVCAGGASC